MARRTCISRCETEERADDSRTVKTERGGPRTVSSRNFLNNPCLNLIMCVRGVIQMEAEEINREESRSAYHMLHCSTSENISILLHMMAHICLLPHAND